MHAGTTPMCICRFFSIAIPEILIKLYTVNNHGNYIYIKRTRVFKMLTIVFSGGRGINYEINSNIIFFLIIGTRAPSLLLSGNKQRPRQRTVCTNGCLVCKHPRTHQTMQRLNGNGEPLLHRGEHSLLHAVTAARQHCCTPALLHVSTAARHHCCTPALLNVSTTARHHCCTPALLHVSTAVCTHSLLHARTAIYASHCCTH